MAELAQRLLAAAECGDSFDLAAVSGDDIRAAVKSTSEGPEGATLFAWLCQHPQSEAAQPNALEIVRCTSDPGTMIEIVAWLTRGAELPAGMQRELWREFLKRAEDRDAHYGVRSHALYGAMFIAQRERSLLRRFQGTLLDIQPNDDGNYLRHAAKVIGAVLAHEADPDLRSSLGALATVEEAEDEAAMELGLDSLRNALEALEHEGACTAFRTALEWFERASATGDGRPDAELYRRCLEMLVCFQARGGDDEIVSRVQGLQRAAFEYAAYLSTSDRPPDIRSWLGSSARERIQWSLLGMRLGALDTSLGNRAWLHAADVIEQELLSVYTASRSFLLRNREGGLEAVLRPRISGALQKDRIYLDYLDRWITENTGSDWLPDAEAMRREVAAVRERSVARRPHEAATGSPMVAAILEKGQIPPERQRRVLSSIEANVIAITDETTSAPVAELVDSVLQAMEANSDYREYPEAKQFFDVILLYTIRYLVSRHNLTESSQSRVAFLFNRDPKNLPLEKDLQVDYHEFLMGSPLAEICRAEARDLGGGRVDILFPYKWIKTVAELKRTEHDYGQDRLVEEYGLQTVSYQTTNVTFGILMVLDLFDRGGGQPHVRKQVSMHPKTANNTEYSVVLFRLQGRRKKPSEL
jgi:hypothetical protein